MHTPYTNMALRPIRFHHTTLLVGGLHPDQQLYTKSSPYRDTLVGVTMQVSCILTAVALLSKDNPVYENQLLGNQWSPYKKKQLYFPVQLQPHLH